MRFLRYSFGEIVLVVIGILIALQINNWNEERIEQKEIREYALNLAAAIDRDLEMLLPVELQIRTSIRQAEELANYLRGRSVEEMDNAELFFLTTHFGYRPYAWNRAGMEWPLLSQDLAEFRYLANINRDFAKSVRPRVDIELPRLRRFAVEVQTLIDEEYR